MFTFLLVLHAIIAACLVAVILMQKSEGGGLGMGGSPSGLMSARGAADFLTRATGVLATLFVALSIAMAVLAATRHSTSIDTSLARKAPLSTGAANTAPPPGDTPFGAAARDAAAAAGANGSAPARTPAPANDSVPLAQ
ncbi:preprotein translocase subunit SecG [Sphingomonas koreensis]|nr:preprotein translocase subunit SecG [Sphingomonas koreensis]